jgi:hypothetical protein
MPNRILVRDSKAESGRVYALPVYDPALDFWHIQLLSGNDKLPLPGVYRSWEDAVAAIDKFKLEF